jgi:hypothetical protein
MVRDIEEGFRLIAMGSAISQGFSFAPNCFALMNDMIHNVCSGLPSEDTVLIEKAQQDMALIISRMVGEAKRLNKSELEELTFYNVRKLLCPMPPWFPEPCPE